MNNLDSIKIIICSAVLVILMVITFFYNKGNEANNVGTEEATVVYETTWIV